MSATQILVERRDAVLLITLNRPEKLNAWTTRMSVELGEAITEANDDPGVGAIVLTGAGRGFCAGADIGGEFAAQLDGGPKPGSSEQRADWVALCRSSKPLLAALNGAAIGVGLTMVLPFDRLVAAASAKLSVRFVRMGLVPELASSRFLVARCGWGAASWMALTGATVLGDEAARMGLVDRVVPDSDVLDATLADAALLAESPMPQVRMIKNLLTLNANEADVSAVQRRELDALQVAYATPEHKEAVRAFLEKRPPNFHS
jgi:enoyl-CoA hydratase/carnithine racemase